MSRANGFCVSTIRRREPKSSLKKRVPSAAALLPEPLSKLESRQGHVRRNCRLLTLPSRVLLLSETLWATLHFVERAVRCRQQPLDGFAVFGKYGDPDADRDWRTLSISGEACADSLCDSPGFLRACLRKDNGKLVAPISRRRVYLAAMGSQNLG